VAMTLEQIKAFNKSTKELTRLSKKVQKILEREALKKRNK